MKYEKEISILWLYGDEDSSAFIKKKKKKLKKQSIEGSNIILL